MRAGGVRSKGGLAAAALAAAALAAAGLGVAEVAGAADVHAVLPYVPAAPGVTVDVAIDLDTSLAPFGVRSIQYTLPIDPGFVTSVTPLAQGLAWTWGAPFVNVTGTGVHVVAAGVTPITSSSTRLHALRMTLSLAAPVPADMALTFSTFRLNEGAPSAGVKLGLLQVRNQTLDAPDPRAAGFVLRPPAPNPASGRARVRFQLPPDAERSPTTLSIHAPDGRRIRTLFSGGLGPGPHEFLWDARDDHGRPVPPGLYLTRLGWNGGLRAGRLVLLP